MGLVKAKLAVEEAAPPPADVSALVQALGADDPGDRRRAAHALAVNPAGAEPLCARLEIEPDVAVRDVIATSLLRHRVPAVVDKLIELLRAEDAALRNQAIELLAAMPDMVEQRIEAVLSDPDADVRIFGVNILATLPHARVPEWLGRVAAGEAHVNVCAAAVDALAEVGTREDIPALEALKVRFADEPFIAFACDAAIARIGGI